MLPACPSEQDLLAFHRGTLREGDVDTLAEHLESCAGCEATIRRLDQKVDPLLDVMRKHIQANSTLRSGEWPRTRGGQGSNEPAAADVASPENWPKLPGYEIVAILGRGGMGVVYHVRHLALGRAVALKHLQTGSGPKIARSRLEAQALAGVHHPNIVQIHEIVEHENSLFLSLELVEGGSLATQLGGKPQAPLETARLLETVARAVQHAHERGIIHRDLKPANILLSGEPAAASGASHDPDSSASAARRSPLAKFVPKIADFGLAKRMAAPAGATLDGDVIGTPSYMAPEQAAGRSESIGPAADIYGLGVMLYEMVTGRVPLQGVNTLETLYMVCASEPVPPRKIQPGLPRDLETICLKCLQKDPERRYRSAAELAEDLRRFRANLPIVARPTPHWERGWKWVSRQPALAGLLILSLGVVVVGFPLVLFLWLRADRALVQVDQARNQLETAVYAGNIALADHDVHDSHVATARSLLDRCIPAAGRPDLRGWEWHYLHRLCHADLLPQINHRDRSSFWVFALSFHPSNKYFVSAAGLPDGTIAGQPRNALEFTAGEARIWDATTGVCLATLTGHKASIQSAAFSPDGRWLATGAADGSVVLWDGATFARRASIPSEPGYVNGLVFTPDSQFLAVGSTRSIRVWDLVRQRDRYVFAADTDGKKASFAISPDGQRLAGGMKADRGADGLNIWDLRTGRPLPHAPSPGPVSALAFSPDGQYLAIADGSKRIAIWDAGVSRLIRHLSGHSETISSLTFCADGRLVSGGEDRTVRVWNPDTGKLEAEYGGHELGILCLAASGDGSRLASADKLATVKVWDPRESQGASFNPFPGNGEYLGQLAFSADGRHVLDVSEVPDQPDHYLEVRDASTGHLERRLTLERRSKADQPHRLFAFSNDAQRVCGVDWADNSTVRAYDTQSGTEIASCHTPEVDITAVTLNYDGTRLAQSGWKSVLDRPEPFLRTELSVRDLATGRPVATLDLPSMHVATQLAFSPDGQRLAASVRATAFHDRQLAPLPPTSIYIWDLASGNGPLFLDNRHAGALTCLAFSPDGSRLASVGVDHTLQLVDAHTGRAVFPTATASGLLTGVVFSPDGRRLATAGMDGIVRLWDAATGTALLSLRGFGPPGSGHYGFTARLAFSPDGSPLASNDWDATVTIWDANPRQ